MTRVRAPSDTDTAQPHQTDLDRMLPQRIRDLRQALNITARELDDLTQQGAGTTGRLERGEQRVYAAHLFRITLATGVDIGWFYGDAREGPPADAPPDEPEADRQAQRLLAAYLRIHDPVVRRNVFDLIANLANKS